MSAFRFVTDIQVRWGDVDSFDVINNARYLTYFEQTRWEYFAALGLLENEQFPFVLAEATTKYLRPGRVGAPLRVAARVSRLGNSSLDMDYEGEQRGERIVTGRAVLVYVDAELRPRPIPDAARRAIAAFERWS